MPLDTRETAPTSFASNKLGHGTILLAARY